jgi:hypothetical protein
MALVCAACGQPGPPFHLIQDCPVMKARQRPRELPELRIWDGKTRSDARGKVWTRPPPI